MRHELFGIAVVFLGVSLWSILCRISKMSVRTNELVFWQFCVLAVGFFATLCVLIGTRFGVLGASVEMALAICAGSNLVFLLAGAARWWDSAPEGTLKVRHRHKSPRHPIDPKNMSHITGGKS